MGYISTVSGELDVIDSMKRDIHVPANVVSAKMYNIFDRANELWWVSVIEDTENGYTITYHNSGKAYEIESDVQKIVDYFANDGYTVNGDIRIEGEDSADFARVLVKDNVATYEKANVVITFPNGDVW